MSKLQTAWYLLTKNRGEFCASLLQNCSRFFKNDERYLKLLFRCKMGYWMDFEHPKTFNEKLQWLKIHDRKPEYIKMVDKAAVKRVIADKIGEEYIIPTLGIWDKPEDIEWDELPNQFVLKTTHGGGGTGVVICKDKSTFDKQKAILQLRYSLRSDVYQQYREWPYKDVNKRIIAEQYLLPSFGCKELNDYKFFCFGGSVSCYKVDFGRFVEHHANYFDLEGHLMDLGEVCCVPDYSYQVPIPSNMKEMIAIAEKISSGHTFLRVDLYNVNGKIYFGETTFYPAGGFGMFTSREWDEKLGELINI